MEKVSVRQLRNDVSRILRRVRAGERLIITSDGHPVAEIGPIDPTAQGRVLDELIRTGAVIPPRTLTKPRPARPVRSAGPVTTAEILDELRSRG